MTPRARALVQRASSAVLTSWVLCACGAALPSQAPPESPAAEATSEPAPEPAAAQPSAPDEAAVPYAGGSGAGSLTEMDALEHDLLVSEQNVDAQLDRKQKIALAERSDQESASGRFATPPPSAPTKAPPEQQARPRSGRKATKPPAATSAPAAEPEAGPEGRYLVGSPCDIACRALGSMRRSAERLCVLAGADHPRCQRANSRVSAAADRVRQAGCVCVECEP